MTRSHSKGSYEIKNEKIVLPNGKEIIFDSTVVQIVEVDEILIVRLDVPSDVINNENVYGVTKQGKIVWRVPPIKYVQEDSPYSEISIVHNSVKLFNWDGTILEIDPKTGKIIRETFGK